ncbi:MAG: 1,4-alpha-glucan branching protein GlgB [Alphaproteobacteria bacterium]|nr:1,4-alpha-glucan branching protein GlgB [Alphaproteobacteria bacterium]
MPTAATAAADQDAIAIVRGEHRDPFSWLGPHRVGKDWVIRTFQPRAVRVFAIDARGRELAELPMLREEGLFAGPAPLPSREGYRLRVDWGGGVMQEIEDPYRFPPGLGEMDVHLLGEGSHQRSWEQLGAHCMMVDGVAGVRFAVWAPNAHRVSVVGGFNGWDGRRHPMRLRHGVGVWELFVPGVGPGEAYKYELLGPTKQLLPLKADPYGFYAEVPPRTASIVYDLGERQWEDAEWMAKRNGLADRSAPISIYEVHLASWRLVPEEGGRPLTYLELADQLGGYVREMGFTHVELLPIHEHPFSGSWGYQPVGLFAPTSRFGTPEEFRGFVDSLHRQGIGVIIDWVAGHFPTDPHGLGYFDGTHLYEHQDPRQGLHRDWNTLIYNFGRNEVVNYLYSNALFWLEEYHIDGLRVDAVASMLYLDYSREPGEWIPNRHGGNENLEAIDFVRRMNELVYGTHPGVMTVAEESTAWPMVSRPTWLGGLGFGYKWNMGWMHDTLRYMGKEPIHRRYHHDDMTFGLLYAFQENFVLPLSHDEVVHGKRSILGRMPGDRWQRFANLRAYYGFMWTHPGKKLLFMGCEFGQEKEWNHNASLDWHLLDDEMHQGVKRLIRDLNQLYRETTALHQLDNEGQGFAWLDPNDRDNSVFSFLRRGADPDDFVIVVANLTPVSRETFRIGAPRGGFYREVMNTDSIHYGGSNFGNAGGVTAEAAECHGQPFSLTLRLAPLATMVFRPEK